MNSVSVYLHIPFCRHRCAYCDFNTYAGLNYLIHDYVEAICREIQQISAIADEQIPVHTVYFGGGTPSLLPPHEIDRILTCLSHAFAIEWKAEISLEANPGTLSREYLKNIHAAGINRLSLGVQSMIPGELKLLERQHDFFDVNRSITWARQAGFYNLNLDLIFGLPYQSLSSWKRTLDLALGFRPEHFSLYSLTIEHGTPLQHWVSHGLLPEPDPDLAADMYEWAAGQLDQAGYVQYEISNWAVDQRKIITESTEGFLCSNENPGYACRHNLQYWHNDPYLGLGAGAHGYIRNVRTVNILSPKSYIQRLSAPQADQRLVFPGTQATTLAHSVSEDEEIGETMMMGLRLTREGVSRIKFQSRFGKSLEQQFHDKIDRLLKLGLLEWGGLNGDSLRLTQGGRLLGNQVFVEFV
jgi:oxygen-independent coproporphyrinogen-3 oxidase